MSGHQTASNPSFILLNQKWSPSQKAYRFHCQRAVEVEEGRAQIRPKSCAKRQSDGQVQK